MKLISKTEAESIVKTGEKVFRQGPGTRLTPIARDIFSENGVKVIFDPGIASAESSPAASSALETKPAMKATKSLSGREREALFHSKEAENIKRQICDMGTRMWHRGYVDANGGNISCRIGPDEFLCTPTLVSKGFMKPEMICMVDGQGKQLAGTWKRTSEVLTHLAIFNSVSEAIAVVHAHPVHATAFAMAGFEPPERLIPEMEIFVGRVPVAPYRTPGSQAMADVIVPLASKHQVIMMGNHGLLCWGKNVEDAYFKLEITDAYCQTVVVASHIPNAGTSIPSNEIKKLLDMKKGLGLPDSRMELKPVQLCEVDPWAKLQDRACACSSNCGQYVPAENMTNAELEAVVQQLTDQILTKIQKPTG